MSDRSSNDDKLRIIAFGAHPDDAEIMVGGTAMLWGAQGHEVELVSATNGDGGHTQICGPPLGARRYAEVQEAAKILGTTTRVLNNIDGELMPTLENRRTFARLIRQWKANIVISHRPNDYHPDHRNVGVLVQDAAFMVTVPFFCPETPHIPYSQNPVFLFMSDNFKQPQPFRADIAVAIDTVVDRKIEALMKLESQFVENTCLGPYPKNDAERAAFAKAARERLRNWFAAMADRFRDKLIEYYGEEQGRRVRYAEAFEICEYGRQPTPAEIRKLFPFFPADVAVKSEDEAAAKPILSLWGATD